MASDTTNPVAKFQLANRLSGRTCMITGGTSGIGFAIAERFLQEGASRIILVGRSQERLQKAAEKISVSNGTETSSDQVRLVVGDVGEAGTWMRELEKEMVSSSQYMFRLRYIQF
jgi:NAD(P)-dependent dehydrogenase (short-subunit alcohol dehydrogenase family)